MKPRTLIYLVAIVLLLASSCSITRNVPEGGYVVRKIKIEVRGKQNINVSKLKRYIQQPQLRRFLGIPIYAYIYNIPDPAKDTKRLQKKQQRLERINKRIVRRYDRQTAVLLSARNKYYRLYQETKDKDSLKAAEYFQKYLLYNERLEQRRKQRPERLQQLTKKDVFTWWEFLRKIGQPPPIYNQYLVEKSVQYIKNYLKSQGYYHAQIDVRLKQKGNKVDVVFVVNPGPPLIIDSVVYQIPDKRLYNYITQNPRLKLKKGHILSIDYLKKYRLQVSNYLKEKGYFYFSPDLITFEVDTMHRFNRAKVIVKFATVDKSQPNNPYERYYINNVYVFTDYNPNLALENPEEFFSQCDTNVLFTKDSLPYYFIRREQDIIKPKYILKETYIRPRSLYKFSAVRNTYLHLSKFAIYKLVDIDFAPVKQKSNYLDCNIKLTPGKSQSVAMEIVGTSSSPTIGGAINLIYKHRNLFHGGEIFTLKYRTALEIQKFYIANLAFDSLFNFNTSEFGFDAQIMFPRLLLPFSPGEFIEKNNPKTVAQLLYNYQDRPEYNRLDLTATWSYYWKANPFTNHIFTPVRISSVRVWDMIPEFVKYIQDSYLQQSYENYFIIGTNYSFTFSNQGEKRVNTFYFQTNFSSSGNLLYEIMRLLKVPQIDSSYYVPGFNTVFAQFVKLDYDFRLYHQLTSKTRLVWRVFMGVGVPYKNSKLLPFGERYFIGGSNSIRAWQARTLGPGSYKLPEDIRYPNQTGDIRLETNLEYRYPLIWKLEGATFLDVGNIWAINKYDGRPGALFRWDTFYKQLAVGTGLGLRLNLGLIVLRFDLGVKLYDPAAPEGMRFIPMSRPFRPSDFTPNIAIGYPF